jgi:hypothetical protein
MNETVNYQRGAFIAFDPGTSPDDGRTIPFRFNPEMLSRQLTLEQAKAAPGTPAAPGAGTQEETEQAADASSGTLKHSFSVLIRFDLADRIEAAANLPADLGILPELAALEELMYPVQQESDNPSDGSEPVHPRPRRPAVLFVWGRKRVFPVRITGMKIDETMYSTALNPVRAEVEVSLEVLGEEDARNNEGVRSALDFTGNHRREHARLFYENTADQGSNILPLSGQQGGT